MVFVVFIVAFVCCFVRKQKMLGTVGGQLVALCHQIYQFRPKLVEVILSYDVLHRLVLVGLGFQYLGDRQVALYTLQVALPQRRDGRVVVLGGALQDDLRIFVDEQLDHRQPGVATARAVQRRAAEGVPYHHAFARHVLQ